MTRIAVIGSLNMDLVVRVPRLPEPGETIISSEDLQIIPGGKGANQAFCSAKLGAEVSMTGRVGDDAFGEQLVANLKKTGVDTRNIIRDTEASTGIAMIVVEEGGQNSIVVSPGANGQVGFSDISKAEAVILSAGLILLQLEIPLPAVIEAARFAKKHEVKVVLNPAPAQKLPDELLSLTDILIPNEMEAAMLSECNVGTDNGIRQAAAKLHQSGVKTIIMTRGSRGASLMSENEIVHFPAFPIEPVDTTGAGDAFVASFAVAFAEGHSIKESIRYGNAAGALASIKYGAQPSMPCREDLDKMLQTI